MSAIRSIFALWLLASTLGCDGQGAARSPADEDPLITNHEIALQQGPTVAFDVGVDATYCAATVRCEPELLVDPFTGKRTTTLVLAYTCRAGGPEVPADPPDPFQVIQRRMTCYNEGEPGDPASWSPSEGNVVVPLREEIYAGFINALGDVQYNLAVLPLDALRHAFCRFEAWGVLDDALPDASGARTVSHLAGGSVVRWEVFLDGASPGAIDCHLGPGGESSLRLGNAVAVTHTRPVPSEPGRYPRTQSFVVTVGALQRMQIGASVAAVRGLHLAYGIDAMFPAAVHSQAGALHTRDLWFADPVSGAPRDITGGQSCAMLDQEGELDAIAVEVLDWWSRSRLGAVVIHDTLEAERFACEHDAGSSACRLIAPAELGAAAPCLAPTP